MLQFQHATPIGSGSFTAATQTDQETATSNTVGVTPAGQQFHPSACKFWVKWGVTTTISASYNTTSITDTGSGNWTVNIATDFSSANWAATFMGLFSGAFRSAFIGAQAAGRLQWNTYDSGFTSTDDTSNFAAGFGDQ